MAHREGDHSRSAAATYFTAQLPDWILGAVVAWVLWRWAELPGWVALALLAVWVAKDFAAYPRMKRFYEQAPAGGRMVGQVGKAVTEIAPRGLARIQGELWQARLSPGSRRISEGGGVRVVAVDGLLLTVEPGGQGAADAR